MWKTALHLWHIVSPKQGNDEPLLHFFDTFFYERMRSVLAVTPRCWDLGSHLRILHTIPPNFSITHSAPATWIYFPSTSVSLSLFKKNFFLIYSVAILWCTAPIVAQLVKNLSAMRETWVLSLGWEGPLEKEKATHSSTLAWRIPWIV